MFPLVSGPNTADTTDNKLSRSRLDGERSKFDSGASRISAGKQVSERVIVVPYVCVKWNGKGEARSNKHGGDSGSERNSAAVFEEEQRQKQL